MRHDFSIAAMLLAVGVAAAAESAIAQPSQGQINAIRQNCRSDYMAHCTSVTPGGPEALHCLQQNESRASAGCRSALQALKPPPAAEPPRPAPAAAAPPPREEPAPAARPPAQTRTTAVPPPASTPRPQPAAQPAATRPTAQQQAALRQHCQSDFMSRCRGVQPGGADALRCLQRNSAELSPNCRSAVAALGGRGTPAAAPAAATAPAQDAAPTPTPEQQSAVRFTCRRDFMTLCRGVTPGGPEALACLQSNAARLSPDCKTSLAAIADDAPTAAPTAGGPIERPIGPLRRMMREKMMGQ